MRVLDLTHTIAENMPVYPGTETPIFAGANTYEKDGFKETKLTMYTHTGTHMDPPAHLFAGRTTLDAFPASQFIGKALVIECSDLNEGKAITLERILQYGKDAENADFLLFHLGWDKRWGTDAYFGDYPCLDDAAMDYIIAGDYKGIGFDVIGLDATKSSSKIRTSSTSKTSRTSTNAARGCFRSAASRSSSKTAMVRPSAPWHGSRTDPLRFDAAN